ncbi:MAG: hypothetical protein HC860_16295 [Alkalinema sp. RU_4_3]|nr:hypothetical protein [Alkalinema sp. RU_4_3]
MTETALVVVSGTTPLLPIFAYPDQIDQIRRTECCVYTNTLNQDLIFELSKVHAIIALNGGRLAHLAIVCRERGIPVISGVMLPPGASQAQFYPNEIRLMKPSHLKLS